MQRIAGRDGVGVCAGVGSSGPCCDPTTGVRTPNLLQAWDVQQEVNLLHADRRLVGLEVWRVDGTPLFTDAGHPRAERALPVADRERARTGLPWVMRTGGGERGVGTVDVFLPYLDADGQGAAVAKVLLPSSGSPTASAPPPGCSGPVSWPCCSGWSWSWSCCAAGWPRRSTGRATTV